MNRKYLIVAPSWVGDMIMAQSLFIYLKKLYKDCSIDIVAPKSSISLSYFMPEIRKSILADFKHGENSFKARKQLGKSLIKEKYTHAIILPNSWKSALIPFFAKIPIRTGWKGEMRYFLLNDIRKLNKEVYGLMIERFCNLAIPIHQILCKKLPFPQFKVNEELLNSVLEKWEILKENKKNNIKVVALCSGAEFGPAKKWPTKYYNTLANMLIKDGYFIYLLGGPNDKKTTDEIFNNLENKKMCINFASQTNLHEAVAILSLVNKTVSNDSGLMHISCALDKKTLVIYGSTSDKFTPPLHKDAKSIYLSDDEISCRPCFQRECPLKHMDCLNKLTPKIVYESFQNI